VTTRSRKTLGILAATAILATSALAATAGTASADPSTSPRPIVGVGSDTTDPVMNGLAEAITLQDGSKPLASYDAIGPTFNSRGTASNCEYLDNRPGNTSDPNLRRPNGSTAGRNALIAARTQGNPRFGCLDFARSSSLSLSAAPVQLTYIPFAQDGLTYAVRRDSIIPKDLTQQQLTAIYNCELSGTDRPAELRYVPLIPQAGSGTRQSWLAFVGLSEAAVSSSPCVRDTFQDPGTGTRASVQEHDGRGLVTKTSIVPFAASQWAAQSVGAINDRRFEAVLGGIGGVPAIAVNPGAPGVRQVYNVVPTNRIGGSGEGDALLTQIFVGQNSEICKQGSTIGRFGLATVANCGATNQQTPAP
jgi:ABC-type phosphate transport system substrate-binding protein